MIGAAEALDLGLEAGAGDDRVKARLALARAGPPGPAKLGQEVVQPDAAAEQGGHAAIVAVKARRDRQRHQPRMGVQQPRHQLRPAEGGTADEDHLAVLGQGQALGCDASARSYERRRRAAQW